MSTPGIPTVYKSITFRSRNEARWAAFFDRIGWGWEYEPLDAHGYLPDFVIKGDAPLLVEVKPDLSLEELARHQSYVSTAIEGVWDHDVLIVGSTPLPHYSDDPYTEREAFPVAGTMYEAYDSPWPGETRNWSAALWHQCRRCLRLVVHHEEFTWSGRPCGHYDGDHYLEPVKPGEILAHWRAVHDITRWTPG